MMRGFQHMPSEAGRCFSVDFSHQPWDQEVPYCRPFLPAAHKGLTQSICPNSFESLEEFLLLFGCSLGLH